MKAFKVVIIAAQSILLFGLFSATTFSQTTGWKMAILVNGASQDLETTLTKTMTTELGTVKSIAVVKEGEDLRLLIQVFPIAGATPKVFAVSTMIVSKARCDEGWVIVSTNLNVILLKDIPGLAKHVRTEVNRLVDASK